MTRAIINGVTEELIIAYKVYINFLKKILRKVNNMITYNIKAFP